jgi:hypothetical protein
MYQVEYDADVLEAIAAIEQSEPLMRAITALAESRSIASVISVRAAISSGQDRDAAMHEARAQVWDELPETIRVLAEQWRRKGALQQKGK